MILHPLSHMRHQYLLGKLLVLPRHHILIQRCSTSATCIVHMFLTRLM